MDNFKTEIIKKYQFFYDMDNTLALWCEKNKNIEVRPRSYTEGFFANLPPIGNCEEALSLLVGLGADVFIISACIDTPYCKKEKMEWLNKYLPFINDEHIILCNMGEDKSSYAKDIASSILIDDYGKNLATWKEAGGIAIKKSYSNKKRDIPVIRNHMEIFDVIKGLEVA